MKPQDNVLKPVYLTRPATHTSALLESMSVRNQAQATVYTQRSTLSSDLAQSQGYLDATGHQQNCDNYLGSKISQTGGVNSSKKVLKRVSPSKSAQSDSKENCVPRGSTPSACLMANEGSSKALHPLETIFESNKIGAHKRAETDPHTKRNYNQSKQQNASDEPSLKRRKSSVHHRASTETMVHKHKKVSIDGPLRNCTQDDVSQALGAISKEIHISLHPSLFSQEHLLFSMSAVQLSVLPLFWQNRALFNESLEYLAHFLSSLSRLPVARWPLLISLQKSEIAIGYPALGLTGLTSSALSITKTEVTSQQELVACALLIKSKFKNLVIAEIIDILAAHTFSDDQLFSAAHQIISVFGKEGLDASDLNSSIKDCLEGTSIAERLSLHGDENGSDGAILEEMLSQNTEESRSEDESLGLSSVTRLRSYDHSTDALSSKDGAGNRLDNTFTLAHLFAQARENVALSTAVSSSQTSSFEEISTSWNTSTQSTFSSAPTSPFFRRNDFLHARLLPNPRQESHILTEQNSIDDGGVSSVMRDSASQFSGLSEQKEFFLNLWSQCKRETLETVVRGADFAGSYLTGQLESSLNSLCIQQMLQLNMFWSDGLLKDASMADIGAFMQALGLLPPKDWQRVHWFQKIDYFQDSRVKKMDLPSLVQVARTLCVIAEEQKQWLLEDLFEHRWIYTPQRTDELLCALGHLNFSRQKVHYFFLFCLSNASLFNDGRAPDISALLERFKKENLNT